MTVDLSNIHASPSALYLIGDVRDQLAQLPDGSVDCLITSPPYYLQRSYLPGDDPAKVYEIGTEATPGEYLDVLLDTMDAAAPKLAEHATFWVNLGDTHAGSGGSGGDYNAGGLREGQARWAGTKRAAGQVGAAIPWRGARAGFPQDQSVCWLPYLFGVALAYGHNPLTGVDHHQWVTRPPVTWCKPSVSPGALERRFRTATELIVYGGKHQRHFFDLDAVRQDPKYGYVLEGRAEHPHRDVPGRSAQMCNPAVEGGRINANPAGSPPFNWWVIGHGAGYAGAHFATFPEALLEKPIKAGCPTKVCLDCGQPVERVINAGYINPRNTIGWDCGCPAAGARFRPGLILDPFAGSGTTGIAAISHGRSAVLIDLDARNADLAQQRVGMFLTIGTPAPTIEDVAAL